MYCIYISLYISIPEIKNHFSEHLITITKTAAASTTTTTTPTKTVDIGNTIGCINIGNEGRPRRMLLAPRIEHTMKRIQEEVDFDTPKTNKEKKSSKYTRSVSWTSPSRRAEKGVYSSLKAHFVKRKRFKR